MLVRRQCSFGVAWSHGALLLLLAFPVRALDPQDTSPVPDQTAVTEEPSNAGGTAQGRGLVVPNLDVFFPEGELDLRLNRLIDKVFFEGQVKYDFVDGDITAFLRYRYYGYHRTYQLSVFDAIEFEGVEELSEEFERVRGALFITQWPQDFHHRAFLSGAVEGISSNKVGADNGKTNTFLRLGYQVGTPDDSRSNAIVGESRAEVERLFTPFRAIGPGDVGLTTALTYGFDTLGADFDYLKLELEALKRFELPRGTFLIGRFHHGTFLTREPLDPEQVPLGSDGEPETSRSWRIPRNELFRLGGRNGLKTASNRDLGTEEVHTTWELLLPWFVDQERPVWRTRFRTWYWVLYGGVGALATDRSELRDFDHYRQDVGVGFQASLSVRRYTLFLSALLGQELEGGDLKLRFSLKSTR